MDRRRQHLPGRPTFNNPLRDVWRETETMSTGEEDVPSSAPPGVHTALRDPNLQIRLLLLDAAGSDEDIISATLEVWDRGATPTYRSISYVCGDAQRMHDITVNGSRVSVRHNCYYALWQARLHFPESRVWIDAICINQLDLDEKTAQVMMMFETYSKAEQVLACIGPSDTHSDVVLGAMRDLDMFVQKLPLGWKNRPLNMEIWDPPLDEKATAQLYDHYQQFGMRPYFTRVWVLQELAGGRERTLLLCGREISDWSDLEHLAWRFWRLYFHEDGPYKGDYYSSIFDICAFAWKEFHGKFSFPRSLLMLHNLQCQDVRDRIYSTHVLIDWNSFGQAPPVPDYRISPLELALQLVDKMPDPDLYGARIIAHTLGLLIPAKISQVLQELRGHQRRTQSYKAPNARYRKWCIDLYGVQMVQQGDTGRPWVQFGRFVPPSTALSELPNCTNFSGLSEDMLAACRLLPVRDQDGILVALLGERTRPGDIFIRSRWFDLVLRPHVDGNRFVVVGRAFLSGGIELASAAPFADECNCYWESATDDRYQQEWISIAIELSDVEALEVIVRGDYASNVDCNGPEFMERCTFGEIKAGAHVWDITAEEIRRDRWGSGSVGMGQLPCDAHRAGDYYWKYQKFLWYSVLMGSGPLLYFPKEDES